MVGGGGGGGDEPLLAGRFALSLRSSQLRVRKTFLVRAE